MADAKYKDKSWLMSQLQSRTVSDVASECGVTERTIHRWVERHQQDVAPSDGRPYTDGDWLSERWFSADSVQEIASEAGCSPDTISKWAKKHGLPPFAEARPWSDQDRLRELYHEEKMSQADIASKFGCSKENISQKMREFGIETRGVVARYHAHNPAVQFYTHQRGYEYVQSERRGETQSTSVHQLLAIAEGADPHLIYAGTHHVHHKNHIRWDNRPENIEVMEKSEHAKLHYHGGESNPNNTGGV